MILIAMLLIVILGIVSYIIYLKDETKFDEDIKRDIIKHDPVPAAAIKENIKPVPDKKTKYQEYLQTDYWKERRLRALRLAEYKCQLCGKRNVLFNVHHNTYSTLYHEKDCDLIVLCNECHKRHHRK